MPVDGHYTVYDEIPVSVTICLLVLGGVRRVFYRSDSSGMFVLSLVGREERLGVEEESFTTTPIRPEPPVAPKLVLCVTGPLPS